MKKLFYPLAVLALALVWVSCNKTGGSDLNSNTIKLETRAQALGFESSDEYVEYVQEQCARGNHENCNILPNGEHYVCNDINHEGQQCTGEHYEGAQHGNCGNAENSSCCSNKGGRKGGKNNGNNNGGNNNGGDTTGVS